MRTLVLIQYVTHTDSTMSIRTPFCQPCGRAIGTSHSAPVESWIVRAIGRARGTHIEAKQFLREDADEGIGSCCNRHFKAAVKGVNYVTEAVRYNLCNPHPPHPHSIPLSCPSSTPSACPLQQPVKDGKSYHRHHNVTGILGSSAPPHTRAFPMSLGDLLRAASERTAGPPQVSSLRQPESCHCCSWGCPP